MYRYNDSWIYFWSDDKKLIVSENWTVAIVHVYAKEFNIFFLKINLEDSYVQIFIIFIKHILLKINFEYIVLTRN